jgi:drug/metabolite transporter (DMT)-like permease
MNSLAMNLIGVFTVSLAWGFGGPASYYVTRSLTSSQATFGRCGIAFLGLLPFLIAGGRKIIPLLTPRGRLLIVASGLTLGVHFYCFVSGVAYASLATAVMLVAVEPVLILSVGVIAFKEKLTLESIIAIIFCVLGIAVISILPHLTDLKGASPSRGLGDFAAVAAILTYALYYGLNRSFKKEETTL